MIKGQVISGEYGKILIRQKAEEKIELGELLVGETKDVKILLQAINLLYGSQISQQNLELISGMSLEDNEEINFMDAELRNYNLAVLKNLITISGDKASVCKRLPAFFSSVREITKDDLRFLTQPRDSLFVGNLRSGSKVLELPIYLDGKEVFSHHILVPATTGRGKSLDENEEVLIKTNNRFSIKSISELVNNNPNFQGSEVISMNPKNYSMDFKKIIKFVKHKAPHFMYNVLTESGREVIVTGDHNLYVLQGGRLMLLKTRDITNDDYAPLPLKIDFAGKFMELNLFELLKKSNDIYVLYNKNILNRLKPKNECLNILSKYVKKPLQKYNDFIIKQNKIQITFLKELLHSELTCNDLKTVKLTDQRYSLILKAIYPITKEFLQLLGYYIAEGYCLNDNSFRISCSEKLIQNHLKELARKIGLHYFFIKKNNKDVDMGLSSSIFTKLLKKLEVGEVSGNKRLPYFFLNLSDEDLRILLRTYFEGDGGVDIESKKVNRRIKISATTKSKKLANDVCIALYRYGLLARCKKRRGRATNTNHKGGNYYRVSISGKSNLRNFLSHIGFQFERKGSILKGRLGYKENTNVDVIPVKSLEFKKRRLQTGLSQKQFSLKLNCSQQIISLIESGRRRPSRDLFSKIISRFNNFKDLSHLLNFRWDKINEIKKIKYNKKYVYDLTIADNNTFLAGHGGIFVHNSNMTSVILWDSLDKDYCGILVLDPHDEYYGRNKLGLKDHPSKEKVVYYTPSDVPAGCKTLKINLNLIKPQHFNGVVDWSDPQVQALNQYYREYGNKWIESIVLDKPLQVDFFEGTIAVIKRRIMSLLDLEFSNNKLFCNGVFDLNSGESTISDICKELEESRAVIIDTSDFSGSVEILIGSLIVTEIFNKYRRYKMKGLLKDKPVISVVLEEAPRVLGKEAMERGPNIFSTIAREGRKFKVGLFAITQLPSLIPREILANMNTKIILGIEMKPEREAIIQSAAQDLSDDDRNIASLDIGEAIISSNFVKFALPINIPLFGEFVKEDKRREVKQDFAGVKLS